MLGPKRKNKKKRPSNKKKSNPITNPIGERQSLAPTVPLSLDEIERRCNKNAMTKKKPSLMKCADGFIIVALFFFLHSFLIGHGPGAVFISGVGVNDGLLRKRNLGLICAETNKQTNKQNNRGTFSSDCPSGFKLGFPTNWFFFFVLDSSSFFF